MHSFCRMNLVFPSMRNRFRRQHPLLLALLWILLPPAAALGQGGGPGDHAVRSAGFREYQASRYPTEFAQIRLAFDLNTPRSTVTVSPFRGFAETGYLLHVRDSALVMARNNTMNPAQVTSLVVLPLADTREIVIPGRSHVARGATAGLAIGAVASLIIGYGSLGPDEHSEDFWSYVTSFGLHSSGAPLIGTILGGAVGAGIGALLSHSERHIVDFDADDFRALRALSVYTDIEPSCLKEFR